VKLLAGDPVANRRADREMCHGGADNDCRGQAAQATKSMVDIVRHPSVVAFGSGIMTPNNLGQDLVWDYEVVQLVRTTRRNEFTHNRKGLSSFTKGQQVH
jgi:hypothetical protein